jgi:uncharacterized protein (TIGR02099 family)
MTRGQWILRRSYQLLWALVLFVLVVLALYTSLGRQYIGLVDKYQAEIVAKLNETTGLQVDVERLTGSWSGLSPVLGMDSLSIGERQPVKLSGGKVELDIIGTVLGTSPRASRIEIDTLQIEMQQGEDGKWALPGIDAGGGVNKDGVDALISAVLSIRHASLNTLQLVLHYESGEVQRIRCDDFGLWSDGYFRRVIARVNTANDGQLRVIGESYGDPRDTADFSATAYFDIDNARLSALSPLLSFEVARIQSPVSGEFWFNWREGVRLGVNGILQAPKLDAGALWKSDEVFEDVALRFAASHRDGFWRLSFAEFEGRWRSQAINLAGLSLRHPEPGVWRFELPGVDVGTINTLLVEGGVITGALQDTLLALSPEGYLRHLQLDLIENTGLEAEANDGSDDLGDAEGASEAQGGNALTVGLRGELDGISLKAWHGAPGATGLAGYVEYQDGVGRLLLDSAELSLDFPHVYKAPLSLSDVRADLRWSIDGQHLNLYSGKIEARDDTSKLAALLRLDLPLSAEVPDEPTMTLAVGAEDLGLDAHRRYVPYFMSDSLRNWLESSLQQGHAGQAAFLYRGSLVSGDNLNRSIQLRLNLEDGQLKFQPDWPAVRLKSAELIVDNSRVLARDFADVDISGITLDNDLTVEVSPQNGVEELQIAARAKPAYTSVKKLFRESPLGNWTGDFLERTRAEGAADVDFQLRLPLVNNAAPQVNLLAELKLALLQLPDLRLSLNDIRGPLRYDSGQGLHSDGLKGLLFGQTMTATVSQEDANVQVKARSHVAMEDVSDWLNHPALSFTNGDTDIEIDITTAGETRGAVVRSDMRGVEIQLPQPLYKPREELRKLVLYAPFESGDSSLQLTVGNDVAVGMDLSKQGGAVAVNLGSAEMPSLQTGQLVLGGELDFASLEQWQRVLQRYATLISGSSDDEGFGVVVSSLKFGELGILGQVFKDITLSGESTADDWALRLSGDSLAGEVFLPRRGDRPLQVNLQRLYLPAMGGEGSGDEADPRTFPAIDFDVTDLQIGERDYGRLGFDLRSDTRGARFERLRGEVLGVKLNNSDTEFGRLQWLRDEHGDTSRLEGVFAVSDLGRVLEKQGYSRIVETRSGSFDVALEWPASPDAFNILDADGVLDFRLREGRFLKSSETASGALRILSIFNMANILRRLKFDFRDVFSKGIYFDEMRAELLFAKGQLSLATPLIVDGPSSRFQMTGGIDLHNDIPDMRLIATLPVGSNLPWVAALIGGLPAAAGAYLVSKVFEEQVDRFSSAVYDISGTLQHPEVSFRRVFDTNVGKDKDKGKATETVSESTPSSKNNR